MEVLYSPALRRCELVFLTVTDLDAVDGTLAVRQCKGCRDRLVPMGERAISWVDRYLSRSDFAWCCPPTTAGCSSTGLAARSGPTSSPIWLSAFQRAVMVASSSQLGRPA